MNVYKICTDLGLFSRRPRLISRPWPWLDSSTPHGELILTVMGGAGSTSSSASSSGNVAMRASSEPWHVVRYSHASRCWMLASEEGSLSVTLRGKQWRPWLVTMTVVRPQSGAPCTERVLDVSGRLSRQKTCYGLHRGSGQLSGQQRKARPPFNEQVRGKRFLLLSPP